MKTYCIDQSRLYNFLHMEKFKDVEHNFKTILSFLTIEHQQGELRIQQGVSLHVIPVHIIVSW